MRRKGIRGAATAAVVAWILVTAAPAVADNDPYGTFTSSSGQVWVSMSVAEYLAQPVVQEMQRRMAAVAAHDFRAGDDMATEDDPVPGWTVVRDGRVTRFLTRKNSTRTIRYVGPRQVCRRTAARGVAYSIAADAKASWRCRDRSASTRDGEDYVAGFLPRAAVASENPEEVRVLLPQESLGGLGEGGDVDLHVIIKETAVLASVGLAGGPGRFFDYYATDDWLRTRFDESNGDSWNIGEFQLSRRGVPALPSSVTRLVR